MIENGIGAGPWKPRMAFPNSDGPDCVFPATACSTFFKTGLHEAAKLESPTIVSRRVLQGRQIPPLCLAPIQFRGRFTVVRA